MPKSLDELTSDDMKDLISKVQSWEKDMWAIFTNNEINVNHAKNKLVELEHLVQGYMKREKPISSTKHRRHRRGVQPSIISKEWLELEKENIFKSRLMRNLQLSYHNLSSSQLKLCLLSFAIFPENSIIKKRTLIYWWIGEGLVSKRGDKTAEQVGEEVYDELKKQGLIEREDDDPSPLMNRCKMHPWIRYMLLSLAQDAGLLYFTSMDETLPEVLRKCPLSSSRLHLILGGTNSLLDRESAKDKDVSTVFNVNEVHLTLHPRWLSNMKKLVVLQLGRWLHSSKYHIEVDSPRFLDALGVHHKHLKFLSLRGISRIRTLPDSIVQLVSLEILDLRACHNLENLPEDIASLKNLTHLDVSECYFMESMPKGTEKLSSLQVLKGFVIRTDRGNPSRISDLRRLTKLRRLSIFIGRGAAIQEEEFASLKDVKSLCSLTISWGVTSLATQSSLAINPFLPHKLEKLELIGIPVERMPKWLNADQLKNMKKLYIIGGKLESWEHQNQNEQWSVEILRLKHLKKLSIGKKEDVLKNFPRLQYFERINCADENLSWYKSRESRKDFELLSRSPGEEEVCAETVLI